MSTLKVDEIQSYSGGDISIGSVTGSINQNLTAPNNFQELPFSTVNGANIGGQAYNRVFSGFADYTSFGNNFSDYYTIEYYDGFGYNFGSEFNVNGIQTRLGTFASGTGAAAEIKTTDNGDGTAQVSLSSDNIVVTTLGDYADDTAAAAGGVKVNGLYRSGSQVMIRVS